MSGCKEVAGSTSQPHSCSLPTRTEESALQSNLTLRLVLYVVQDPEPDDRGQLMLAAIVEGGQTVALTLSAN